MVPANFELARNAITSMVLVLLIVVYIIYMISKVSHRNEEKIWTGDTVALTFIAIYCIYLTFTNFFKLPENLSYINTIVTFIVMLAVILFIISSIIKKVKVKFSKK
jgi:CDP-diglyceride synthetase